MPFHAFSHLFMECAQVLLVLGDYQGYTEVRYDEERKRVVYEP